MLRIEFVDSLPLPYGGSTDRPILNSRVLRRGDAVAFDLPDISLIGMIFMILA